MSEPHAQKCAETSPLVSGSKITLNNKDYIYLYTYPTRNITPQEKIDMRWKTTSEFFNYISTVNVNKWKVLIK